MAPAPNEAPQRRWIDGPRLLIGIVLAALAAGPVFFLAGTFVSAVLVSPGVEVFRWAEAEALPLILLLSVRYAFLPAILPATLGAAVMAVFGAMFPATRSWFVWLLAGAVEAGVICLLVPDLLAFPLLAVALLIAGLVCALICRAFARWPADEGAETSA